MSATGSDRDQATIGRWGGRSGAERIADRRRRLLQATRAHIFAAGAAAVTIHDVCAAARLNKRYFYESFVSVDDLVEATLIDACKAFPAVVRDKLTDDATAADWARAYVEVFLDEPELVRLALTEPFSPEGTLSAHRDTVIREAFKELKDAIDVAHADEALLQVVLYSAIGAMTQVMDAWLAGNIRASRDKLVDHAVGVIIRILAIGSDR